MSPRFIYNQDGLFTIALDLDVYGLEPVLKAAHHFTDRCFVHVEWSGEHAVICRFKTKRSIDNGESLAGDFCNEVLDQTLRAQLAVKTEPVRRLLLAQAFSKNNLLHPELDGAPEQSKPPSMNASSA